MGWMRQRLTISSTKKAAKVSTMNIMAYLVARSVRRYTSTGLSSETEKLSAATPSLPSERKRCCAWVDSDGTLQLASKPWAETLRLRGRKSPPKLGCGQGEVSVTLLSSASGTKPMRPVPARSMPSVKSSVAPGCSSAASTAAASGKGSCSAAGDAVTARVLPPRASSGRPSRPRRSLTPSVSQGCPSVIWPPFSRGATPVQTKRPVLSPQPS